MASPVSNTAKNLTIIAASSRYDILSRRENVFGSGDRRTTRFPFFREGRRNDLRRSLLGRKQPARFAMKVRDAMTTEVQLCTPDDTLRDAAEAMAALNCGLLPVTDNQRLVGMISDRDIAIRD